MAEILSQPFFSEITSIGINGGEPSLYPDIVSLLESFNVLKKLKSISFISNGVIPRNTLNMLEKSRAVCKEHHWRMNFTVSLDGVQGVDDEIRGVKGHYDRVLSLIQEIKNDMDRFCDALNIGCTISKYNVCYLPEIDTVFKNLNVPVEYHLAVPNKRIYTFDDSEYSVLNSPRDTALAAEFFLRKYSESKSIFNKLRYWGNYYYLIHHGHRRPTECTWLLRDVTIDENLNMYLCATASDRIGSLRENTAAEIIKSKTCKTIAKDIKNNCCDKCIHYSYTLSVRGLFAFAVFYIKHSKWNLVYYNRFLRWLFSR